MESLLDLIRFMVGCGTLLLAVFCVLLAMPQSKLRGVVLQIVGWAGAIFCGMYVISPVDVAPEALLGPFGFFDDLLAIVAGFVAASTAMQAGNDYARLCDLERDKAGSPGSDTDDHQSPNN